MSFFSPSLLKRPDSHGTNLESQRQPVKAHKKFLNVCGGREYPMYLQTLKVMEETRWRGRCQKQQADNGIYNARDLTTPRPGPIIERAEIGNRWKMLLRETQNEKNPSVSWHGLWLPCLTSVSYSCWDSSLQKRKPWGNLVPSKLFQFTVFFFFQYLHIAKDVGSGDREGVGLRSTPNFST